MKINKEKLKEKVIGFLATVPLMSVITKATIGFSLVNLFLMYMVVAFFILSIFAFFVGIGKIMED